MNPVDLISSLEKGSLGVCHMKRYWQKHQARKKGLLKGNALQNEWRLDNVLLAVLSLGLEQTTKYLYTENNLFEEFEQWVLHTNNGTLDQDKIVTFNTYFTNKDATFVETDSNILTAADMDFWNEHGYIIVKNAVSKEDCEATIAAICEHICIDRYDPKTWYENPHPSRQGIMVQLFQHDMLTKNRQSTKIRAAYEQLWQRKDLWMNTDRVGFNPPETDDWKFPGPKLHWDVSLKQPIPFGLQGILYLADTAANQGAFTLVPGFQHKVSNWLDSLPKNTIARNENIYALGAIPIVANAGDFIIWHHALPHGSSENTSSEPRFVQYMNLEPLDSEMQDEWI